MKTTHNCQKNLWALAVQTETWKQSMSSSYLSDFQTSQENSVLYQDNPLVLITSVIAKLIVIVSYRFLCVSRLRVNYQWAFVRFISCIAYVWLMFVSLRDVRNYVE